MERRSRHFPGKGQSRCKGPEVRTSLACCKNHNVIDMPKGLESARACYYLLLLSWYKTKQQLLSRAMWDLLAPPCTSGQFVMKSCPAGQTPSSYLVPSSLGRGASWRLQGTTHQACPSSTPQAPQALCPLGQLFLSKTLVPLL